jgi:hypothetical protein
MQRRYKALIAIIVPIVLLMLLNYFHPVSYNILIGYIFAVVLVFKSSLLSLWFLSKLKILSFLKGLTIIQALLLGIKRWFIDNLLSKWIDKHIVSHFKEPFKELFQYYQAINFKTKIKNFIIVTLPLGLGVWVMYMSDLLTHFALFVELKVLIIGFFKALWVIVAKIFIWLTNSWFAPILEVFALSYLLTLIEKRFGVNNPISRFLNYIGAKLNNFLTFIGVLNDKHIDPILNRAISQQSQTLSSKLSSMIKAKKIRDEQLYFDNFQNIILKGHINTYYSFKGMDDICNKKELYTLINQKTDDNMDIIAYVSRNDKGELLDETCLDTYYHDIFLLKGIASNQNHGVQEHRDEEIDYTDFWVLNTSTYPVWIKSHSDNLENSLLQGHEMQLIKTKIHVDFEQHDLYFEHENRIVHPTSITNKVL